MVYITEFTKSELRKVVEKQINHEIQDYVWDYLINDLEWGGLNEPYDQEDIPNIIKKYNELDEVLIEIVKQAQDIIPKKLIEVTHRYVSFNDIETVGDPLLLSELRREELKNHPDVKEGREVAEKLRKALGFAEPVPLPELKLTLLSLGAIVGEEGTLLSVPTFKKIPARKERELFTEFNKLISKKRLEYENAIIGLNKQGEKVFDEEYLWGKRLIEECETIMDEKFKEDKTIKLEDYCSIIYWENENIAIPKVRGHKLEYLPDLVLAASNYTRCHPALTLAFVMCDVPFFPRDVPKLEIIKDGQDIQIHVNQPEVSPKLIARQYREVRNFVMAEKKEVLGKWLRSRCPAKKTITLISFIENNGTKIRNWKHLLQSWNNNYPKWKYNDMKQMQLSYYKAKKRYREG